MNFLSCDGLWRVMRNGSVACDGRLKTFTVQEMRDSLTPSLTMAQKAELTGALLALLVSVWVIRKLRSVV